MNRRSRDLRFTAIQEIGCLACRRPLKASFQPGAFAPGGYVEIHHLLTTGHHGTGKRRGDDATIGLCSWHHRGVIGEGYSVREMADCYGPSYAREPRRFRAEYGSDEELLAEQNTLIAEWRSNAIGASAA
ncbi:hypothetical protein CSC62_05375 [Pseudoxanthomonas jiangsuensis]|uniref:Ref family recombination enhancement nuclease n=1 Tax=Pseudoxanthomonas jiangsuensis TaxID=619688 RepID=UPI0013914F7C|nr:Ref family recombination enhancement nuclease [Pseudoxanthomonas jiangsuensis]KAF1698341.1 hypothetical protein CSC62_05375 [Pseudoxanthomonas jiangsuensis]